MNICKLMIAVSIAFLAFGSISMAGEEVVKNDVVYVTNSDVPSQGAKTLHSEELWRIGGQDESVIFKSMAKVSLGRDDNLYILDNLLSMIYVYTRNGDKLREESILGEGPGELSHPVDMVMVQDDKLGLLQQNPAKLICLTYGFKPSESFFLSDLSSPFVASFVDWEAGFVVVAGNGFSGKLVRETFLAQCSQFGEIHRYISYPMRSSAVQGFTRIYEEDFYFTTNKAWDADVDGQLFVSPYWNGYTINVYNEDAKLSRVIKRDFESRERSKEDKEIVLAKLFGQQRPPCEIEDFHPDILEICCHPDGNTWVRTSRSDYDQAPGVLRTYDVFSPQGHFIQQVSLMLDGDGYKDIVYLLDENTVAVVKGQVDVMNRGVYLEEDSLELIMYSVK